MKPAPPLQIEIYRSALWQLNSIVLSYQDICVVVDPGYFPVELDRLIRQTDSKEIQGLVFTHGHFDHVLGGTAFPNTPTLVSPALKQAVLENTTEAQKNQVAAAEFEARYYIQRPFAWPNQLVELQAGSRRLLGPFELEALLLPGHSHDGLGLYLPESQTLIVGDYLSPCEIPFVEDAHAYQRTLSRFLKLLPRVNQIIPGHGPALSTKQAVRIAEEDLRYIEALLNCHAHQDLALAQAIPLPRAEQVPGMKEEHLKNCKNIGL